MLPWKKRSKEIRDIKAAEEPRVKRDTNGFVVVKVDEETQKLIALKVEALAAAQLPPENLPHC